MANAADPPAYGVEGGVDASYLSPTPTGQSTAASAGVLVGGYAAFPFIKTVGIQFEALYTHKHSSGTDAQGLTRTWKLDYFEVPILAKLALFKGAYILEGISIATPVRARSTIGNGPEVELKGQIRDPDIGLVIGVVAPVKKRAAVEGRYEGGFRIVDTSPTSPLQRNRSWSALLRYKL